MIFILTDKETQKRINQYYELDNYKSNIINTGRAYN